ncbi:hypothetical protein [Pedobacter aquatilis]|uniref:hypothetical protein n=1 Tax=Pedobacter aquatilis TaxID=351343 RepID=UPI00292EB517|nr:hypothetical protein [Pedobacter aquatilis]
MMRLLRKNLLRSIFGLMILSLMTLKFSLFSISTICGSKSSYAIEKSTEESKEKEDESFEKVKKKLLLYETLCIESLTPSLIKGSKANKYTHWLRLLSFPARNVPTPPPNTTC